MGALFFRDDLGIYRAAPLLEFSWLEHGFGTRWTTAWNRDADLVTLRQIHSDICLYADGPPGCIGKGDALMTDVPSTLLSVHTADCLPILIVDDKRQAVAVVHAGWRGTVRRIAARVVEAMAERFSSRLGDLHVAVGPGIGVCCYEVGGEVASQFSGLFPERTDLSARTHIDLTEANGRQLLQAGVRDGRIYTADWCTSCKAKEFHSWRRDRRRAGRMLSVIGIRG